MRGLMFVMGVVAFGLCCGCESRSILFASLEERQANAVLAALLEAGISAQKESGEEERWRVVIPERDFATATVLLEQHGLPERAYRGVGEVFRKTGMVSSPSEERIRLMDALSQDLARTLSVIEGVVEARVHVVLPENDPFAKTVQPSSAAVAIRHRWDADMVDQVPRIKSLVKNAIEGLRYETITVTLFRDPPPQTPPSPLPAPSLASRWGFGLGLGCVGLVLLLGFGALWWHRRHTASAVEFQ